MSAKTTWFLYAWRNLNTDLLSVDISEDLFRSLLELRCGGDTSSGKHVPVELVYFEIHASKIDALQRKVLFLSPKGQGLLTRLAEEGYSTWFEKQYVIDHGFGDRLEDGIESWLSWASHCLYKGYYFEVITVSFNCINMMLRDSIRVVAKDGGDSGYLESALTGYDNAILGKASDRSIYDEALRLEIISKDLHKDLHQFHETRNIMSHRLFQRHRKGYSKEARTMLAQLAEDYYQLSLNVMSCWPLETPGEKPKLMRPISDDKNEKIYEWR